MSSNAASVKLVLKKHTSSKTVHLFNNTNTLTD